MNAQRVDASLRAGALLDAKLRVPRHSFDVELALSVREGEVLALMGPSGSGKSTALAALAGTVGIESGRIVLDGRVLADPGARVHVPPSKRAVGLLGQDPMLFPHMTVTENIAFAARPHHERAAGATEESKAWLERLELGELAAQHPAALSGGQRQRVALARALAARPRLLLLDEPFSSLDVEAAQDMRVLVGEQLARSGTTSILVSHDASDALALADRLVVIESGRIVQHGEISDVLAAPVTRFVAAVAASAPRRSVV
ncbi:MAG TPA: ABC transporter ATP-binding protein [Microbacteriaceae bacterium]|nr:ABC transporter ATP-binding protein [Microbacteriaceae bacterium]